MEKKNKKNEDGILNYIPTQVRQPIVIQKNKIVRATKEFQKRGK